MGLKTHIIIEVACVDTLFVCMNRERCVKEEEVYREEAEWGDRGREE